MVIKYDVKNRIQIAPRQIKSVLLNLIDNCAHVTIKKKLKRSPEHKPPPVAFINHITFIVFKIQHCTFIK